MGSPPEAIGRVEQKLGVRFPQDYKDIVADESGTAGRWSSSGDYLVLDPLNDLPGINEAAELASRLPGAVIIGGDGSRELLVYDFREQPPPLLLVDGWAESWADGILQAESLTALLGQFREQGWIWD
ncbi:SMI1/KNR4 family protein [Actinacidiphila glaucinigra]|uniref:SMI1/KNR4 family protein n=1 Tax=Actinacidiphila glaucinigra TaxID=235986 RepID=UPI003D93E03D